MDQGRNRAAQREIPAGWSSEAVRKESEGRKGRKDTDQKRRGKIRQQRGEAGS